MSKDDAIDHTPSYLIDDVLIDNEQQQRNSINGHIQNITTTCVEEFEEEKKHPRPLKQNNLKVKQGQENDNSEMHILAVHNHDEQGYFHG